MLTKIGPGDKKDEVLKPDRGKGIYVRFKETEPLPDLLARQVSVSMIIPAGDMQGELRQVTTDQTVLGLPLEFNFSGDKLQGIQSIKVAGALNHIDPKNSTDHLNLAVQQYRVSDFKLSAADNLPITLKKGLAHLNLTAALVQDVLDADVQLTMDAAELETGKKTGSNPLQQALRGALARCLKVLRQCQGDGAAGQLQGQDDVGSGQGAEKCR